MMARSLLTNAEPLGRPLLKLGSFWQKLDAGLRAFKVVSSKLGSFWQKPTDCLRLTPAL
jgi:hypothetical protein